MALRRGFKAEAERIAGELRRDLGLEESNPIDPERAAAQRGIEVRSAEELVDRTRLEQLEEIQPGSFSACTLRPTPDRTVIVFNSIHALSRRKSDIAHELAHILLDHRLSKLERLGGVPFFVCDPVQEEEADWLGGCLLLPRALLLRAIRRGRPISAIAKDMGVSEQLARWRVNVTGVRRQFRRTRGGP